MRMRVPFRVESTGVLFTLPTRGSRGTWPGRRDQGVGPLVMGAAALLVGAGLVTAFVVVRPRRVVVEGRSMEPTLAPGDRLLVTRTTHPRAGDVVRRAIPVADG